MIAIMKTDATTKQRAHVEDYVQAQGLRTKITIGEERSIVAVIGDNVHTIFDNVGRMAGVDRVVRISRPFKLASREVHPHDTTIQVGEHIIGGNQVVMIAGPCSVENREQFIEVAYAVREAGAHLIRGGAFKPRTSPYSFQGLGEEGLKIMAEAREQTGLYVVTEVMAVEDIPLIQDYADVFQVGARNTQNYPLLRALGKAKLPVLLKRGMMSTIEELLMSAEYILAGGNENVILCERGIRTFEKYTRFTLDINAVPVLKELTHLPVIIDPSHGTGKWNLVSSVTLAAVAAGADGLLIEVHGNPEEAMSDGGQSLKPKRFAELMVQARRVAEAVDRKL